MRVRTSLILEESLLAKIDELAGEKQRRAGIIESALREYISRQERAAKKNPAAVTKAAVSGKK